MDSTIEKSKCQDDDEFQDAVEDQVIARLTEHHGVMTLERSLQECRVAVRYFFNNQFDEARQLMEPWYWHSPRPSTSAPGREPMSPPECVKCSLLPLNVTMDIALRRDTSIYHAVGYGTMLYLQAVMTFDPRDIEEAVDVLRSSVEVCNRARRKNTLGETVTKIVRRTDYSLYTEEEAHAELCYAECLLMRAILNFVEDETLISMVKSGLKIKACCSCYRDCFGMLEHREWKNLITKQHFESGVRLGVGTFNLMISQLPTKILKLLEFVGFTGSKDVGLRELQAGFALADSTHRSLCSLVLLGYHLVATYLLGSAEGDLKTAESVLSEELATYPNGAFFLFFAGRLELVRGQFERAVQLYSDSWHSQQCWTQAHHMCFWELHWAHVFLGQWEKAAEFAGRLLQESRWSRTIYSYQRAAMLLMLPQPAPEQRRREVELLMTTLPDFKQRIAGKSLPAEKFVMRKAQRYRAQSGRLLLPAYELLYLWNGFKILRKRRGLIEDVFALVDSEMDRLDRMPDRPFATDDRALLLLLRGVCLSHLSSPLQAEEALQAVTRLQAHIRDDAYLVPFAWLELGLLALAAGRVDDAARLLEHAKSGYKGYSMINRLHFRAHSAQVTIAALRGEVEADPLASFEGI